MIIEEIERLKKNKNKVILDNGTCLYLYTSEIKKLDLALESELDEDKINKINEEYIFPRAKKKALAILERSMNSTKQLRTKLKRADYSDEIIDRVVSFLEEYRFLDDFAYAKMYIQSNSKRKSKLELKLELSNKGISSDYINSIFEELSEDTELEAIKRYIKKYQDSEGNIEETKKKKAMAALYRKGFSSELIRKVFGTYEEL